MTTPRESISFIFLVVFPLFEAACYAHIYWKRSDILTRYRNTSAIYVASLAGWIAYLNLVISIVGGVPCGVFYITSLLVAPISIGPQIIRALTLQGKIKYSQLVTEEDISSRLQRKKEPLPTINSGKSDQGDITSPQLMTTIMEANLVMDRTRHLVKMTRWILMAVSALFLVLGLALTSNEDQLAATDFEQCQPKPSYFQYASPIFGIATAVLALLVLNLVKDIKDEIGLRREIERNAILLGSTYAVIVIVGFAEYHEWQPLLQSIQQMMLSFSMSVMPFLPQSSMSSMASWAKQRINPATKSAVPGYAQSLPARQGTRASIQNILGITNTNDSSNQDRREVSVSWDAGLCILLSTEEGITLFSQHCAREFSAENVRFWCAVNDFKANLSAEEATAFITATAKDIYNQYIDQNTKTQVNLSSKQRTDIKKAIDSGQTKRDMFDAAQREIFAVMSRDSYPRFLSSRNNLQIV